MIKTKNGAVPYQTEFTNGTMVSYSDNRAEKGGQGNGFRPHELLEAALANCINMSICMYADHHELALESVSTTVCLNRDDPERVYFEYHIDLAGKLSDEQREKILAMAKNCPVRKTLSKDICFKEV